VIEAAHVRPPSWFTVRTGRVAGGPGSSRRSAAAVCCSTRRRLSGVTEIELIPASRGRAIWMVAGRWAAEAHLHGADRMGRG